MKPLCIGKFVKPYGLKGLLKAVFYVDEIGDLESFTRFYIRDLKKASSFVEIKFLSVEYYKKEYLVSIDGCIDRTHADLYRNLEIFVDEEEVPPLKGGVYYIKDLLDLTVELDNEVFGVVSNFIDMQGKVLLIVKMNNNKELVVPFSDRYIGKVVLEERRIVANNLKELL